MDPCNSRAMGTRLAEKPQFEAGRYNWHMNDARPYSECRLTTAVPVKI